MMKRSLVFLTLLMFLIVARVPARADTVINFTSGAGTGITFTKATGGEDITFSTMTVATGYMGDDSTNLTGDSAMGTNVVISPGSGGHFFLSSALSGGGTGYCTANSAATLTIGSISSGVLTGSLNMIQINSGGNGAFSLTLMLSNLKFSACTTTGCTNSALLQSFAQLGSGNNSTNTLAFTFYGGTNTVASLLAITGSKSAPVAGTFDSVSPEPASLALFGSCLLMAGMKLYRRGAKA
jgi:hypothetical protein